MSHYSKLGPGAWERAAEELRVLASASSFSFSTEQRHEPEDSFMFRFRIVKQRSVPLKSIPVKLNINSSMKTLRQDETQAILVMADQLECTRIERDELARRLEFMEQDIVLWRAEAERWRKIAQGKPA